MNKKLKIMAESLLIKEYFNAPTLKAKNLVLVKACRLNFRASLIQELRQNFIKIIENENK